MVSYAQSGDTFGFERYDGANNAVIALDTGGLKVGTWTYIVATSDGVLYMDGAVVLTGTNTGSVPSYTAETLFGTIFKGELDEAAIYDHVLTESSVQSHWKAAGH